MSGAGRVYFVGAGPGDPRLITLRAADLLARCEAVLFDATIHHEVLERTAPSCVRQLAEGAPRAHAETLMAVARAGHAAVRLSAGDPMLDAGVVDEMRAVSAAGIAIEVVPGVASETAAGAASGVALASRALVIGRADADGDDLATAASVFAIDGGSLAKIAATLLATGRARATPVVVLRAATLPAQTAIDRTLEDLGELAIAGPVTLLVGASVADRHALAWQEKLPLFGKRVLVTRARDQAGRTAATLRDRGAEPVVAPTIELHPPSDPRPLEQAVAGLGERFDWVAFTSANGVVRTFREMERQGMDARALGRVRVAAIGPGTAQALEARGVRADVVANEFRGEGLADAMMKAIGERRARILIARAKDAREVLPDTLRAHGHEVTVAPAYETRSPDAAAIARLVGMLERREVDAVTFTSSSTVDNLCDALGDRAGALLGSLVVASIGPITTATAERRGLRVDVTASVFTVPGLIEALERAFSAATSMAPPT